MLGRNFLRTYNVLVDLAAMRVTIGGPKAPRHFKPIHEVSNHEPSLVVSTEKVVLGPFERKLIRAQVITQDANEYLFRNVMIRSSGVHKKCSFVSEDTLTSVGEDGSVFLAVRNRTANENLTLQTRLSWVRQSQQPLCLDQFWSTKLMKLHYLLWNVLIILILLT